MTDADATIADLQDKVRALDLDRAYWRDQHDLVMQDWRADIEAWTKARADLTDGHKACREALADLLRFFDPKTGAVAARIGRDFLNDAFAKAQLVYGKAASSSAMTTHSAGVSPPSGR
jgi:hypothetical protein